MRVQRVRRRKSPNRPAGAYARKGSAPAVSHSPPAKNTSWSPGRKGQGGEGYSKGYGGSGGSGTGPSGPERADAGARKPKASAPTRRKDAR